MPGSFIQVGVIGRAHGVRGLLRVTSHTANPGDLTAYGPLRDETGRTFTLCWKAEGVAEVTQIIGGVPVRTTDRSAAENLTNTRLFVDRKVLPPTDDDEYYLADLVGLLAVDEGGGSVGAVSVVHDYGAGASLEIEREGASPLILPFTRACVPTVDIAARRIVIAMPEEIIVEPTAEDAAA